MLPEYDRSQLMPYYRGLVENPVYGTGRPNERNGTAGPMWYGYPVNYVVASNYAAMSTGPNTTSEPTPFDPATRTNKISGARKSV